MSWSRGREGGARRVAAGADPGAEAWRRWARSAGVWAVVCAAALALGACASDPPSGGGSGDGNNGGDNSATNNSGTSDNSGSSNSGTGSTNGGTSGTNGGTSPNGGTSGTNSGSTGTTGGPCQDRDLDGYGPGCALGFDCNDERADVHAGAQEVCDGVDNDCDGEADPGCPCVPGAERTCFEGDAAARGVGSCRGGVQTCVDGAWGDCVGQVLPEEETCNGRDDNCDGETDEGLLNACGTCGQAPAEQCGDRLDNDCDGTIDESSAGCNCDGRERQPCYGGPPNTLGVGQCRGGLASCEGQDWGVCAGQVLPEEEVCDGIDNDCDGLIDEGLRNACGECGGPPPAELCDGLDNDCDGLIDEGQTNLCGTCSAELPEEACGDGLDNDCDGLVDEGCGCEGEPRCYTGPVHTRNVGVCLDGTRTCDGEFWTACEGMVLPSAETCNGLDDDCDGLIDEGPNNCSICGPQPEVCDGVDNDCDGFVDEYVTNACGTCDGPVPEEICGDGIDNDCDGLESEGLLNACGNCGDSCYLEEWSAENGNLGEGTSDGVELDEEQGGLRLGRSTFTLPFIWIANSAEGTVSKVNTRTGLEEGRYTVGSSPSRTAVDLDGNVWVGNRGSANVHRIRLLDCEGQACVDPPIQVGGTPRGLAVDANNNVWVGSWDDRRVDKINPQTMTIEASVTTPGQIYGLAIDSENNLWTAERGGGLVSRINTETAELIETLTPPFERSLYGIAIDGEGSVWIANFSLSNVMKYKPSTREWFQFRDPSASYTRGVAVDGDGFVWVANSGSSNVSKFRATDGQLIGTYPVGSGPIGVAIDTDGSLWAVNQGSNDAYKLSTTGQELLRVPVGSGPYTYSDMTGFQLRAFTVRQGKWTVRFDCGYNQCQFDAMRWRATTPPDTSVELRIRTSADGASWSPFVGPYTASPVALVVPRGRYAEVEVSLQTNDNDQTPIFRGVEVDWQRP